MGQRVRLTSELKSIDEGVAKASLNRAIEYHVLDPNPGELDLVRLKVR